MTPTPVGMRCPECANQRTKVRTARSVVVEPRVTYGLIAINVIVFFLSVLQAGEGSPRSGSIYEEGVLFGPLVDEGEWWRLVSSGFLHADPIHLLLNMLVLYFLGQLLEPALGHVKYAALYFAALLCGSLGVMLIEPDSLAVGASGAVYGCMGATVVLLRERGIPVMQTFLGPLIIINILFTFTVEGVSIGAHLGGIVGGALTALLVLEADRRRSTLLALTACAIVAAIAVVGAVVASGTPSLY